VLIVKEITIEVEDDGDAANHLLIFKGFTVELKAGNTGYVIAGKLLVSVKECRSRRRKTGGFAGGLPR